MVECFWLLSPHRSLRKWIKTRSSMSCPLALWRSRRIDSTVSHFHNQQTERKRRKRRGKSWHAFLPFSPIVNELAAAPSALPWRHTLKLDAVRFRAAILQSKSAMTRLSLRMNRRCRDAAIHYVSFFLWTTKGNFLNKMVALWTWTTCFQKSSLIAKRIKSIRRHLVNWRWVTRHWCASCALAGICGSPPWRGLRRRLRLLWGTEHDQWRNRQNNWTIAPQPANHGLSLRCA